MSISEKLVIYHYAGNDQGHFFTASRSSFTLQELRDAQVVESEKALQTTFQRGKTSVSLPFFHAVRLDRGFLLNSLYPHRQLLSVGPKRKIATPGGKGVGNVFYLRALEHLLQLHPDYGDKPVGYLTLLPDGENFLAKLGLYDKSNPGRLFSLNEHIAKTRLKAGADRAKHAYEEK